MKLFQFDGVTLVTLLVFYAVYEGNKTMRRTDPEHGYVSVIFYTVSIKSVQRAQ